MRDANSVLTYLEVSAQRNSGACAVVDENGQYTYGRLFADSMHVGSGIVACGASKRMVVIVLEKSEVALSCMFGALQAGGCYVPVDPNMPEARFEHIVRKLDNPLVVVPSSECERVRHALPGIQVTSANSLLECEVDIDALTASRERVLRTDPAYILFTSGSTGLPKGVVVSHGAIMSFIEEFARTFAFTADDRFANQAPFDFDISVKDIYTSIAIGATLVIVPRRLFMQPQALVDFLCEQRITVMVWAVAALCLVSSYHALAPEKLASVKKVLFSGEVMPLLHLRAWLEVLPQAQFVNLYGPTEITCNCLYHKVERNRDYKQGIPLGVCFAHCEVLLMDGQNQVIKEPGEVGELVVRGPSVALGYVGDPQATACVFVQNTSHCNYFDRVYRTGDRAELLDTGEYLFRGRRDNQIKYMGHRIELEEVDHAFELLPGVERCRCAYEPVKKRLRVFYEGNAEQANLQKVAHDRLPAFMRPSSIAKVSAMPLNKNGKVDRARLLEMCADVRTGRR